MIYVYVDGKRMEYIKERLLAQEMSEKTEYQKNDLLILPIHWQNKLKYKGINISNLKDMILFLPYFDAELSQNNTVFAYMEDKYVVKENAKLTAIGILNMISDYGVSLLDSMIDIVGYGNCAKSLSQLLECLHIPYRFVYYKPVENGVLSHEYDYKANIVINTAPVCVLKECVSHMDLIIDISSEKSMKCLEGKCATRILFPGSLPELYMASSAASIIVDYVRRNNNEE